MLESRGLVGAYEDVRRLGVNGGGGAFSLMMTARATGGERVALKFFNPENATDPYRAARFTEEVSLLQEVADDKYVVAIHSPMDSFIEIFKHPLGAALPFEFRYYAMELARGSVQGLLTRGPLPADAALDVFVQMCRAIQHLHSHGIAHRDSKPENFLLFERGLIKVTDLGAARRLSDPPLMTYARPPGDRRYAPPEQFCGLLDEDPGLAMRGDVFALGAALFELLTATVLTSKIYDPTFLRDLMRHFGTIPASLRRAVFDNLIGGITQTRTVPSLETYGSSVPSSVRSRLDSLIHALVALDYRVRDVPFSTIFRQIQICRVILRNEAAYQRWLAEKRKRRAR